MSKIPHHRIRRIRIYRIRIRIRRRRRCRRAPQEKVVFGVLVQYVR